MVVPGAGGVPFVAVDRQRVGAGDFAGGVKGVDRHVKQQHVLHAVAKAAKVSAHIEIGVDCCHWPDGAAGEKGAQSLQVGVIAPVLDHGVGLAGSLGSGNSAASVFHRIGQRLFAQHMAAMFQGCEGYVYVRFRHGAVKHAVGARLREHCRQV